MKSENVKIKGFESSCVYMKQAQLVFVLVRVLCRRQAGECC